MDGLGAIPGGMTRPARDATSTGGSAGGSLPTSPAGLERTTTSTTPDGPPAKGLPVLGTMGWALGIGAGVGMLLLRPKGAALGAALLRGGLKGGAVGAAMGGTLLGLDKLTGGAVGEQVNSMLLDRRAQAWFAVKNLTKPYLVPMGLGVADDARAAQRARYGDHDPMDGPQDAFRHAYAAALFTQRMIEEKGVDPADARRLSIDAGKAHERDGQDNNDAASHDMDHHNNEVGAALVGDGRAPDGSWRTEAQLQQLVLDAMRDGELRLVDRTGADPRLVATTPKDLPPFGD